MNALAARAHKLRQGSVNKAGVDGIISQALGGNARQLQ